MDVRPVNVRIPKEIERAVTAFARSGIATGCDGSGLAAIHRDLIITLAAGINSRRSMHDGFSSPRAA